MWGRAAAAVRCCAATRTPPAASMPAQAKGTEDHTNSGQDGVYTYVPLEQPGADAIIKLTGFTGAWLPPRPQPHPRPLRNLQRRQQGGRSSAASGVPAACKLRPAAAPRAGACCRLSAAAARSLPGRPAGSATSGAGRLTLGWVTPAGSPLQTRSSRRTLGAASRRAARRPRRCALASGRPSACWTREPPPLRMRAPPPPRAHGRTHIHGTQRSLHAQGGRVPVPHPPCRRKSTAQKRVLVFTADENPIPSTGDHKTVM